MIVKLLRLSHSAKRLNVAFEPAFVNRIRHRHRVGASSLATGEKHWDFPALMLYLLPRKIFVPLTR